MIASIKRIFKPSNRSLIRELVVSDFKLRYQGSLLGYAWSLLRPLFMFGVLYIIFTMVFKLNNGIQHPAPYLLLGLVLWQFFIEATIAGMNAITGRGDLVRKVSIPKYTIILSTQLSAFVTFMLNMVIVVVFMIFGRVAVHWAVLLVPVFVAELVLFCLGLSFLLSVLFVRFRDLGHIWDVLLQVLFYATPIIYGFDRIPQKHHLQQLVSLNPLTQIFQDMRSVLIGPDAVTTKEIFHSQLGRILPMLAVLLLLALSGMYFRRSSKNFAEEL